MDTAHGGILLQATITPIKEPNTLPRHDKGMKTEEQIPQRFAFAQCHFTPVPARIRHTGDAGDHPREVVHAL